MRQMLTIATLFALLSCTEAVDEPVSVMPSDAIYQSTGLWEMTTLVTDIDGLGEKEAQAKIAEANASNVDSTFQECRPELTFAKSPQIGDIMNVGEEQGLTCKYTRVSYTSDSVDNQVLCKNEGGDDIAEIAVSGEHGADAYKINIVTSFFGGISNTVEEKGRLIGSCPAQ